MVEEGGTAAEPPSRALGSSVAAAGDAPQVAAAVVSTWQEIDAALCPIIGRGGVAALYKRSLQLTHPHHPWLAGMQESGQAPMDLVALRRALAQQSPASAAAAGEAMLQTFWELLSGLVGATLGEQLLRSVGAASLIAIPQQGTLP